MIEKILSLDTKLLIYLNNLGFAQYDGLWLIITNQLNWLPLFLLLLYIIFKKIGTKQTLYLLLFVALLIAFTDQATNLFKNGFQRLRPCADPKVNTFIRVVQFRGSYSFFSGHAANSMAVAVFLYLNLKRYSKYFYVLFLWPLIFAYSRIYLGLHFPVDILSGYLFGMFSGFVFYKLHQAAQKKYFPRQF
ncbi:phosphatase PAP2 family protein [Flavobacterium frigoris]|uniref:Membrane-associated phospholipid phosphatase n=1 Tax=Flavobacterium frigoris (strain PS1) TaxID=1086011 RepID=H7FQU0_FLAFP|nr:phosphatase PAP2 family protein [Flavobacterium frigoris]EIA09077.1 putative membrane-associated phospholipid phosphatase [Flavobacterium frigoris PS1]